MTYTTSKPGPYLSIVVASRNDDHGGDMLRRMSIFVKALVCQCNKHNLACELLMVEWNPPAEKQLLCKVLPQAGEDDLLTIRYIVVPKEIHDRLAFSDKLPLYQMIAKNVGIQRARAEFVLCTNVDIVFSDAIFEQLAAKKLEDGSFYRANRCDVPNTIQLEWPGEQQVAFCANHIMRRLGKNPAYPNIDNTEGFLFNQLWATPLLKLYSRLLQVFAGSVKGRVAALDFHACGDFTLMSRKNWIEMQGYPELAIYSIHIDSMGVFAAAALGLKQVVFDSAACIYHMEHTGGWEFNNPIEKIQFLASRPMLEWWAVVQAGEYIMQNKSTYNINQPNWGLSDIGLQEIISG